MMRKIELVGEVFSRLTVLHEAGRTNDGKVKWMCRCECGTIKEVAGKELRNGETKSCGCLASDLTIERNSTHGLSHTSEYQAWKGIKARCYNPKATHYEDYGGRGITMCDRWLNSFENFLDDMGLKTEANHTIERRINSGNYTPENCYWASRIIQSKNKRNNRVIEFGGKKMILQDWANEFKMPVSTLHSALKVKSVTEAFNTYR